MTRAKYLWGSNDPFPMELNFFIMGLGSAAVAALILFDAEGQPAISSGCSIESVKLTILATIAYFFVLYQLLGNQVALKFILQCANETAHRTADRILMNTLEQMGPFLALLWLYTIYVDAALGGKLGIFYAALVAVYAFAYSFYGHFTVCVEFSTQPRYIMILYMAMALLRAAFRPDGPTLREALPTSWAQLTVVLFVAEILFTFPGWMALGLPLAKLNASNNPNAKRA